MISVDECRIILNNPKLSDEDIIEIRQFIYEFIKICFEDQNESTSNNSPSHTY